MTPSTDSWYGIIALVLFVIKSLWDIYREKNKPRLDDSTAREIDQQAELSEAQANKIKADIQRDVLAQVHSENKTLRDTVERINAELAAERTARRAENENAMKLIGELQGQLRERDQVIANQNAIIMDLQAQITQLRRGQTSGFGVK